MIEFGVLGPLTLRLDGQFRLVRTTMLRRTLAVLLVRSGSPISVDALIDTVWARSPPPSARATIQAYISRLRHLLGDPGRIVAHAGSYAIRLSVNELDAVTFEQLADRAMRERDHGDVETARATVSRALSLWRGPAFAGLCDLEPLAVAAARLHERRADLFEDGVQLDLDAGRHPTVVADIISMVPEFPYRERLHGQHMLALYRCGRRGDALQLYRRVYRQLVDDLGVEPGVDLQALHHGILSDDPALRPAAAVHARAPIPATRTPAQLPAATGGFTGRDVQLSALDAALIETPAGQGRIVVVAGTAGVGKTALVVQWARRVRDRFPDGQLYVDLHGYPPGVPTSPLEALIRCIRACGVTADQLPTDIDSAVDAYRSLLADRRILIVLDNARTADQIRPLLPGGDGCAVVVTSRDRLDGLVAIDGAHRLIINRLSPADARDMLAAALGTDRVDADSEASTELAAQCAYLPLALRIAAATIISEHAGSVTAYVERLRTDDRLTALSIDDDPASAVRAAFDSSYLALATDEQRFVRLLSLAPGNDITAAAAEALTGSTPAECTLLLRRLTRTHLIEERTAGRYAAHDLLALYLGERSVAEDTTAARIHAVGQVLAWYQVTARGAVTDLYAAGTNVASPSQPAAWLDAEQDNLVSAVRHATDNGHDTIICDLADALTDHFWHARRTPDWIIVTEAAVAAAARLGDSHKQANAHLNLGLALLTANRLAEAADHYMRAYDAAVSGDWDRGQEVSLTNLGVVHIAAGDLTAAETVHRRALVLKQRRGNTIGQSATMTNLGIVAYQRGDLHDAYDRHRDAVRLAGDGSVRTAEALQYLGYTRHALGELNAALDDLRRSLFTFRTTNSRIGPAHALIDIAAVHTDAARYDDAGAAIAEAIDIIRAVGDRASQAAALNIRGRLRLRLGDIEHALADHAAALAMAHADGTKYAEAEALAGLAMASAETWPRIARTHANAALAIADALGFRLISAHTHIAVAVAATIDGQQSTALDEATTALHLFHSSGHRIGEATARAILGRPRRPGAPDAYPQAPGLPADECGPGLPTVPTTALAQGNRGSV